MLKNVNTYPPLTHIFLKRPYCTDFKKYTHTPPPPTPRNNILVHWAKSAEKPMKMPKPTELAQTECGREIYMGMVHTGPGLHSTAGEFAALVTSF